MWGCMWTFLNTHGTAVQGVAAVVQALAAIVTVGVTVWLVCITKAYVRTTQDALKIGREQFELYRAQFEREWKPAVHVRAVKEGGAATELEVTNLGRMAVVMTCLHVKFTGQEDGMFFHPIPRPFPLASGKRDTVTILARLEGMVKKLGIAQALEFGEGNTVRPAEISVAIRFDYTALGTTFQTEWFDFTLYVIAGTATDLRQTASSISARGR
jgi:hypothetical protein